MEDGSSIRLIIQFNSIQFNACLFTQRLNGLRPHINQAKTRRTDNSRKHKTTTDEGESTEQQDEMD
jgi:hypothetical protein